jgi:hypothetical protein
MRETYLTFIAVEAAQTTGELGIEWFEAVTDNQEEAERLMYRVNAARNFVAWKLRHGR